MILFKILIMILLLVAGHYVGWRKTRNNKVGQAKTQIKTNEVVLPDKNVTIKVNVESIFTYSHSIYGSVGYTYRVEYDKDAFELVSTIVYDSPADMEAGMDGADSAIKTVKFTSLKKGVYIIKVFNEFRGDVESTRIYKIIVK